MENYIKYVNRQTDGSVKRENETRRDTDNFHVPKIGTYDVDYAILYHLQNNIKPTVQEHGKQVQVPVMYANGETWVQMKKYGYIRDHEKKIMTPLIILEKVDEDYDQRYDKLRVPHSQDYISYKIKSPQQTNDKFNRHKDKINANESETIYFSIIPERRKMNYNLVIWTDLVSQMNEIQDKLHSQHKLPWGDAMSFVTYVGSFNSDFSNISGENRIVKTTVSLEVDAIIQSDYELDVSTIRKAHSIKRVEFKTEIEKF